MSISCTLPLPLALSQPVKSCCITAPASTITFYNLACFYRLFLSCLAEPKPTHSQIVTAKMKT